MILQKIEMNNLIIQAINDLWNHIDVPFNKAARWSTLYSSREYKIILDEMSPHLYKLLLYGWQEDDILRLVKMCGYEPILSRGIVTKMFYWNIPECKEKVLFRTPFLYSLEFDQCLEEIKQRGYRDGMKELMLPQELKEHIISFM